MESDHCTLCVVNWKASTRWWWLTSKGSTACSVASRPSASDLQEMRGCQTKAQLWYNGSMNQALVFSSWKKQAEPGWRSETLFNRKRWVSGSNSRQEVTLKWLDQAFLFKNSVEFLPICFYFCNYIEACYRNVHLVQAEHIKLTFVGSKLVLLPFISSWFIPVTLFPPLLAPLCLSPGIFFLSKTSDWPGTL